jgi:superfamily I DNA/RNA helicase/RecB family exonuclease
MQTQTGVRETRVDPSEWDDLIPAPDAPQIIVGGPGTGKTEFLCRRIIHAIDNGTDPASMIVLTFSRLSVNDIRTRLFDGVGSSSFRVQVSTYHSLAHRLVESHYESLGWDKAPTVLAGPEHERFVLSVLQSEDPQDWRGIYQGILHSAPFASELTDFILRFNEQTNSVADLARTDIEEWKGIAGFFTRYNAELNASDRTDYGRLLTDAATALGTDTSLSEKYAHVFADEYQDTSPVQANILFGLARHSRSLTVAADPYQSIYSFRGTDLYNVLDFPSVAAERLDTPASRLVLTTSFRVPAEILDAAVNVTDRELPGAAGKVASVRTRGSVISHVFDSEDAETDWIAGDIERIHLVDGVDLNRIAVFTRSGGSFQQRIGSALERRGVAHTLVDEHLEDQPVVQFVYDLVHAASGASEDLTETVRRLLLGPFVRATPGAVAEASRDVDAGSAWPDAIRRRVSTASAIADLLDAAEWATVEPAQQGLWHLWTELPNLYLIASDDDLVDDRRAWSAFAQVVNRLNDRAPSATLRDQQILASTSDIEADALFSFRTVATAGVAITTLHRAKGTEYDAVYIANAVEGQLPDLRSKDSILKTRLLNPHLPENPSDYITFRLAEERRLAYTAMTRATDRVVWTATEVDSSSEQVEPSRFLKQVAATTEPEDRLRPLTHRGYEAFLRRTLFDPARPDVDRLASLRILSAGPTHGLADQWSRYGSVAHGSSSGFVDPDHKLSPSQATSYDGCPRSYALGRFGTHKAAESVYLSFGNLIHKVLEIAESGAKDSGRERSTVKEAHQALEDVWDDYSFGPDAIGRAWFRRADNLLNVLYEFWPTSGTPIELETTLDIDLDGTAWRGKVDRIERAGDELTVIDYKTSGQAMKVADAASSLQLGYYILAAMDSQDVSVKGTITGAGFWYPSPKPNKTSIVTRSFDMSNLDEVRDRLIEIAQAIHAEEFEPQVGPHCGRCEFQSVCPAQKVGREAFAR